MQVDIGKYRLTPEITIAASQTNRPASTMPPTGGEIRIIPANAFEICTVSGAIKLSSMSCTSAEIVAPVKLRGSPPLVRYSRMAIPSS